jgi:flagellar biosynthesis/type III secretory pathway protein FliH
MATSLLQVSQKNGQALLFCHPKEVSNLRGQKNENILKLKDRFNLKEIFVQQREDVSRGSLVLQTSTGNVLINRKALC